MSEQTKTEKTQKKKYLPISLEDMQTILATSSWLARVWYRRGILQGIALGLLLWSIAQDILGKETYMALVDEYWVGWEIGLPIGLLLLIAWVYYHLRCRETIDTIAEGKALMAHYKPPPKDSGETPPDPDPDTDQEN